MSDADRFALLLEKYLAGRLAGPERGELKDLLAADPARRAEFVQAVAQEAALRVLVAPRARSWRKPLLAAAAVVLVALAGLFFWEPAPPATLLAGGRARDLRPGDVVREGVVLFPGEATRVELRPATELRFVADSGGKQFELSRGEVEATVAPQSRPMVLTTPHARAEVLGTRFTLASTPDGTRLEVSEGRVRMTRLEDGRGFDVAAGRSAAAPARRPPEAYEERFLRLRREILDGYFSPDGLPYHSIETLIVDGPDHGHQTTSEAFSYWLWLEATFGRVTGDWAPFKRAWAKMEDAAIPRDVQRGYDPARPAAFVPEFDHPSRYPAEPDRAAAVGRDPLAGEVREIYGMHWLIDVDDFYGFGRRAPMNTFQRGPEESVWETVPHPSREGFRWGGPNGFLDLFLKEKAYAPQWRYTSAPDAEARAIQALYGASVWAKEKAADLPLAEGRRMGSSLRYALFDKYFRSKHGLVSWYFAWGGADDGSWAWRTGSDHVHFGYQNPVAAWALSRHEPLRAGAADWEASLERQVDFYRWLQSAEGAIAGGATAGTGAGTFHGLAYDEHPVFHDPPSNAWFGWQAWSVQRLAEYARLSGDPRAREVVEKWAGWVKRVVRLNPDGTYAVPGTLRWSGRPDAWDPARPGPNAGLRAEVADCTEDVGVTAALARALLHHGDESSRALARELLDRMWVLYKDGKGLSAPEPRPDYARMFTEKVPLPEAWKGKMPNGDEVQAGATFLDLRSNYRKDPAFAAVEEAVRKREAPVFRYHRFWAQVEVALANAELARLLR